MHWIVILFFLLLFAYLSNKKLVFGIYATIFSLPLYFWKFNILSIPFNVSEVMIYILVIIFLINVCRDRFETCPYGVGITASRGFFKMKQNFIANPILFLGISLLFCGAIIATIFSSDIRVSAGILKSWFFAPVLFFLIFISAVKKSGEIRQALSALVLSGVLVALAAFVYSIVPEYAGVTYDGRLRAFYLSANHLAMYLAPAFIIVYSLPDLRIWRISSSKPAFCAQCMPTTYNLKLITNNAVYYFPMMIIGVILYLTYSYSAWFGVLAAIVFILGTNQWLLKANKSKFIYALVVLFILAGLIFSEANADKFKNILNFSYPSVSSRIVIWQVAGDILKEHWLFGIGLGTFQDYYLRKQADYPPYPEWAAPQPHNIFLAFWLQTGILGLIGFLMILAWFFKTGINILRRIYNSGRDNPRVVPTEVVLTVTCLAVMIYTLVHGLVDTTYWKNDLALIFWLMIGVMYAAKNQKIG